MKTVESLRKVLISIRDIADMRHDQNLVHEADSAIIALDKKYFNVAFIGQFKRGKSTLINAILGEEVLPTDLLPLTSAITIVQFGESPRCVVYFLDGHEENIGISDIGDFVSETCNPGNAKSVSEVVVELPVPVLQNGLRLVDTPGIGSIFQQNTETTQSYLYRIDVAVVVLGSDPPVSGDEMELIKSVSQRANRLIFVINKADQFDPSAIARTEEFTKQVVTKELGSNPDQFFHLSAVNALQGRPDAGFEQLVNYLTSLAQKVRTELVIDSASHSVKHLSRRLIMQIQLEKSVLIAPVSDLQSRIEMFQKSMRDIDDLMLAAFTRVSNEMIYDWKAWESEKQKAITEQKKRILSIIELELAKSENSKYSLRRIARGIARREVIAFLSSWRDSSAQWVKDNYILHAEKVKHETNQLIKRVADAANQAFGIAIMPFEVSAINADLQRMPFELFDYVLALDFSYSIALFLDLFLPRSFVIKRCVHWIASLIDDWFLRNIYRIDELMRDIISNSTMMLRSSMKERFENMNIEVMIAINEGKRRRAEGVLAIKDRLSLLESHLAQLEMLSQ